MKTALVTGAGGFIGWHLVNRLKDDGYYVVGVDIKRPEFGESRADVFRMFDLTRREHAAQALWQTFPANRPRDIQEVYALAADMGGMGFIHAEETAIMTHNVQINANTLEAAARAGVSRYFFASSVCVYPDMKPDDPVMTEENATPPRPDNEYGLEKYYSERMALSYGRNTSMEVRIGRFQNCYGPYGTWRGGREKAPAALCRKVAEAEDGGEIDVWGNGSALRNYTYVDDLVSGIIALMRSDIDAPANIGASDAYSVDDLARLIINESGKRLSVRHIDGPVGVSARNFSKTRIHSTGWKPQTPLDAGINKTYWWIHGQVEKTRSLDAPATH